VLALADIDLASSQDKSALSPALMKGKVKTDRTINLDMIVEASPAEVYPLWTSADGVKTFFAETLTDGPFAESKEAIGGYFIILARDLAAAAEISKSCPIFANGGTIEVRPIQQIPGA